MPKSKVRKKVATSTARASTEANEAAAAATRAHLAAPSSPLYIGIMLGLMILGLLWLVVYYLWGQNIPFITDLGNWNFAIGFALMIAGLLMTMRWR
ncbi:MAG TPA: cell division protein CrgA [Nakamurella sp.]|nr:cell division protein CrgA [Nakamurella sp.]